MLLSFCRLVFGVLSGGLKKTKAQMSSTQKDMIFWIFEVGWVVIGRTMHVWISFKMMEVAFLLSYGGCSFLLKAQKHWCHSRSKSKVTKLSKNEAFVGEREWWKVYNSARAQVAGFESAKWSAPTSREVVSLGRWSPPWWSGTYS